MASERDETSEEASISGKISNLHSLMCTKRAAENSARHERLSNNKSQETIKTQFITNETNGELSRLAL